jgi:tetratricopeptide (TPR) repeat protein
LRRKLTALVDSRVSARGFPLSTAHRALHNGGGMELLQDLRRDPFRAWLAAFALLYAILAGLKTVADYDLGWQLATGRYIVQNRVIPSTDVLSYTAKGNEWIYPPLSGVLLYGVSLLGRWQTLSWLNALACAGTVALLLVRGSRLSALLAILAVPAIDYRTVARAEMFTTVLFAAFAGILWRHYLGERTPLWLLPALMVLWVNLHTGFAAGLALLAGYFLLELLEWPVAARREAAWARLRRAAPWCGLTVLATLLNPWGYRIYETLLRQNQAGELHDSFIGEWSAVRLNSAVIHQFLNLRGSESGDWWLLLAAVCAAAFTLLRGRLGPSLWLAGAAYLSLTHIRFQALFAILVVTVVGSLPGALPDGREMFTAGPLRSAVAWWNSLRAKAGRNAFAFAILTAAILLVGIRSYDLVTDRHYIVQGQVSLFGTGPSWWYPERAADFLLREKLPGHVFNDFDVGGYLSWRLGPQYSVYVDGRYLPFGTSFLLHKNSLMALPPDSPEWQEEADHWNINVVFFSLSRYGELTNAPLTSFCSSRSWKPVYLDDVAVIFLRDRPENEAWLRRLTLDCRTAPLPPPLLFSNPWRARAELFQFYSNAGSIFYVLSRDAEAAAAFDSAYQLFPKDPNLHLIRGQFFEATGRRPEAEQEYRTSINLGETDTAWYTLGRLYASERRFAEAAQAIEESAALSPRDYDRYRVLGQVYLAMNDPQRALAAFDRAERRSPFEKGASVLGLEFHARLAEGRARAWRALGDLPRGQQYADQAVRLTPDNASRWLLLADLYAAQGKTDLATQARRHAEALAAPGRSRDAAPSPAPTNPPHSP